MEKNAHKEGFWRFFYKKKYFSEEKSPGLSQVGRPSTAHPCRGWMGGQIGYQTQHDIRLI
jgi:hypothetical protein